jgi:hypothetical protein
MDEVINKINGFHEKAIKGLYSSNEICKQFNGTYVKDKQLGDIPIHLIYQLYDNNRDCKVYGKHLSFIRSLMDIRKDYNIIYNNLTPDIKAPDYFHKPRSYQQNLKSHEFILNLDNEFPKILKYEYTYTHPVAKKSFMGPSKLNMFDTYKIILVSPKCLIVEITSYISGFMLMDTFFNTTQYRYDADISFDSDSGRFIHNTKANFSFLVTFVKDSWLKSKIESGGIEENREYMTEFMLPNIVRALERIKNDSLDDSDEEDELIEIDFVGDINKLDDGDVFINDFKAIEEANNIYFNNQSLNSGDNNKSDFTIKIFLFLFYLICFFNLMIGWVKSYFHILDENVIAALIFINLFLLLFLYYADIDVCLYMKKLFNN